MRNASINHGSKKIQFWNQPARQRARQISKIPISVKENERKVSLIIRIELFRDLYIDIFLNKMLLVFSQRAENSWIEMKSNMRYTKRKFPKASLLEIITSVLDDD